MKKYLSLLTIILLLSCNSKTAEIQFTDVSVKVGLDTKPFWKYGGPTIADINQDGHYDLLLGNHDQTPVQLFWANGDNTFTKNGEIFPRADLHGMAAGDYDKDGDLDLLLSLGGGNGLTPQPQRLLRNDNGDFNDVTEEAGLSEMGARGRSVRWIDLDNDGDLDFLQINAAPMVNEKIPRNILFENKGDGTFVYKSSPVFEQIDAERLLITDFDNDHILDLLTFSPYAQVQFWKGNNDFTFTDMSKSWLPEDLQNIIQVMTVAEFDLDNDGDLDYYFARGKSTYQMANNAVSFNVERQRLDLRDEGNKSHDGITFYAEGEIELLDFYRFPRGPEKPTIPLFIGKSKVEYVMPTEGQLVTQNEAQGFPEELDKSGWYLGYFGEGKWRLEWLLKSDLAWDVRASIKKVTKVEPDWIPQDLGVQDILLRNDGGSFTNITAALPEESKQNNTGIIAGDFNNDGLNDLFVYRYGELKERIPDALFINQGKETFTSTLLHGATPKELGDFHGDMGTAFDYNHDGQVDIFSGDEDAGQWHMYQNATNSSNNYALLQIGNSTTNVDAYGAKVNITSKSGSQYKLIGSGSASHAQCFLSTVHFGLGSDAVIQEIEVTWRDGAKEILNNAKGNQLIKIGSYD